MQTKKHTGRLTGLLFLATFIAGVIGTINRGLTDGEAGTAEFISNLVATISQMKLAIGLDTLTGMITIIISIFLYPLMEKFSKRLAIAYVLVTAINFTIVTLSNSLHLSLIYLVDSDQTSDIILPLSSMFYNAYYSLHFLILILYSFNGATLYYFMIKSRLMHQWIGIWGLVASFFVFIGGLLQLLEFSVPFVLFAQNGIFMLVFICYLLVAGFREELRT